MASKGTIKVNPVTVKNVAKKIDDKNRSEYTPAYSKMFAAIKDLGNAWQSDDYNELARKAESFQKDFDEMAKIFGQYSSYLEDAAKAYQQAEDDTLNDARAKLKS